MTAAAKTLDLRRNDPDPHEFIDAARVLIFLKGTNAHDYKFSSAVLEDYKNVSPQYRGQVPGLQRLQPPRQRRQGQQAGGAHPHGVRVEETYFA